MRKVNRRTKENKRRKETKKKLAIFIATLFLEQTWPVIIKSKNLLLLVYLCACLKMSKTFFLIILCRLKSQKLNLQKILLWGKWVILVKFCPKLTQTNI